eukprot:gnl/TRDRNA2_/TRDRNA2_95044_c0_seq1.p1 gnl/TRDRNA2_/TRDRNA2_95044_c0~~gnl/TRDRNA2_/TRDRNA2_95044_c0_seq1.p1  ORF type:complete len:222 (+),score=46.02 gnl/TRDRNA2_/TRDRNA2_95044_c0_seq1:73-738(+)
MQDAGEVKPEEEGAAELDEQGFQNVLSSGSQVEIQQFVQRVIFVRGGTVKSLPDLERFARECKSEVRSFDALVKELEYSNWVIWPCSPEIASAAHEAAMPTAGDAVAGSPGEANDRRAQQEQFSLSATEEENFQKALASGSEETMRIHIRRAVFILGGTVKSEHDLDDFTRETASGASGAPRSHKALVHELHISSWVVWPSSSTQAESSLGVVWCCCCSRS